MVFIFGLADLEICSLCLKEGPYSKRTLLSVEGILIVRKEV